jgi:hypothetical protein
MNVARDEIAGLILGDRQNDLHVGDLRASTDCRYSGLPQQLRQLRKVPRDPPRLVAGE